MMLRESVAFDAPTAVPDGYGGTDDGWSEQFTARAHFRYLRGGETVQAARMQGRQPVVMTIRRHTKALAVTAGYRIRDLRKGTIYNVRSVVETENRQFVEITAESGVAV